MYLHLLTDAQQNQLKMIAVVLSFSDNEVLWDGRRQDELTGETDLTKVAFVHVEQEFLLLKAMERESGGLVSGVNFDHAIWRFERHIELVAGRLLSGLRPLPISMQNNVSERIQISRAVIEDLTRDTEIESAPLKVMVLELLLLALADGEISSIEGELIRGFADAHGLDADTFDKLLGHAMDINREAAKTISIIFE